MASIAYTSYVLDPHYKAVLLLHSYYYGPQNEHYNEVPVYIVWEGG